MKAREIIAYLESLSADLPAKGWVTVDTLKTGDPQRRVTKVVSAFMATAAVIREAHRIGAQMIITHEPTFWSHTDETDGLGDDPVYRAKRELIGDLVIYRCHDGIHSWAEDGIYKGVNRKLGWGKYVRAEGEGFPGAYDLPEMEFAALLDHLKTSLGCDGLRVYGRAPERVCSAALFVGACGGETQIGGINRYRPQVAICGEIHEWETPVYVTDANELGRELCLVVTGHRESEQDGMDYLAEVLRERFDGLEVVYLAR